MDRFESFTPRKDHIRLRWADSLIAELQAHVEAGTTINPWPTEDLQ